MSKGTLGTNLLIRIAPTIALTIALIGGLAFLSADKEINQVYDTQLISNANVLWTLVADELQEIAAESPNKRQDIDITVGNQFPLDDSVDDYADSRMFRVWKGDHIIMYSDTAFPITVGKRKRGFSIVVYEGEPWRVYSLPFPDKESCIEVGEKMQLRDTLVANILFNLAWPLLLLVPVVGVMIWAGIGGGLGTIRNLVEQIRRRSPDDLSRVNIDVLPRDLAPLGRSLNQLLTKLEESFNAEKRLTDHAAHQLRTPQATIRLQLQMLAEATEESERAILMDALMKSNERATRLITSLLTSARLSHQRLDLKPLCAYAAVASVMAEFGVLAQEKAIEMSLGGDEALSILADEALFTLMMHNLVDNAVKYTPEGGSVTVEVAQAASACRITVCDTGVGIARAERELVFERFYRIATPNIEGSGLGLAMVAEIIRRLSGTIRLDAAAQGEGICVEILLPIARK